MILRPYQTEFLADIRGSIRGGMKAVVGVLPTGGGKTVIASHLGEETSKRGLAIWFIVHRDFLIDQTAKTFTQHGLDFGIVSAKRPSQDRPILICSIDTLRRRLDRLDAPAVRVWDECHHIASASWLKVFNASQALDIGLTATPERLDGRGLNPPFQDMVEGPTTRELMDLGMLSEYKAYAPTSPEMKDVRTVAGEFNTKDVEKAMRESVIMGDIVGTYRERAFGKRAIYFCPSIAYSQDLAQKFQDAGFNAMHVDGETPTDKRIEAAVMFAQGDLDVLTNCSLFGEGYDLAAQAGMDVTIEVVGLVRPTQSLSLHRQQIGRALRPKPDHAIILDHAGNIARHGLPDDDIEWSIFGRDKKKLLKTTKECPYCHFINKLSARVCEECGRSLVDTQGERMGPAHIQNVKMEEIDREAHRQRRIAERAEEYACKNMADYIKLGEKRGYNPRWAYIQWSKTKQRIEAQARAYLRDYQ